MLYHVIRRNSNNNTNISNKSSSNYKSGSVPKLMPRYHYSKTIPNSPTASSESFFPRHHLNGQSTKPVMTATTTSNNNNNNQYSYGSLKSTFIPLVTNSRTITPNKREFIQIPIIREDGISTTTTTNNPIRSVPITFISETSSLPSNPNNNNGNINPKTNYTSFVRPVSRNSQHQSNLTDDESSTIIPRLPSVARRLSLTIPVMTTTTTTTTDDDTSKQNVLPSPSRQIPIRLSQPSNVASIPTNSSRISSAVLRSTPLSNPLYSQLQRQKTDLTDTTLSDFTTTSSNISPVRRAEVMAREAIQGIVRFQQQQQQLQQQQQQQQQANGSISDNNNILSFRSPASSRRVIINLKNNQSVSLDSRSSSGNISSTKPPPVPSSARTTQRNNIYHIPVLHEIQMPPHPATMAAENSFHFSQSPSASNGNKNSFKNEFRMEIPVTIIPSNDQENQVQENNGKEDGIIEYDQQTTTVITERIPSASTNSNQTLKSILKRSSSRETVSRKNVSFMNA